jgi:choline-sulfatase
MDSESSFRDEQERLSAIASYYGLCTWMDHNLGQILDALTASDHAEHTTVVYTSDHGDNVGARGLWGKSNLYEESCAIPLIACGPDYAEGAVCETPVSLLDLSVSIAGHFNVHIEHSSSAGAAVGDDLSALSSAPNNPERIVFSEYHAAGAVSGAFMIRRGRWKYVLYVGFEPELFDLESDPEELDNLASDPQHEAILTSLDSDLRAICNPDDIDALAHSDQRLLIEHYGGKAAALQLGAPGATPPPAVS